MSSSRCRGRGISNAPAWMTRQGGDRDGGNLSLQGGGRHVDMPYGRGCGWHYDHDDSDGRGGDRRDDRCYRGGRNRDPYHDRPRGDCNSMKRRSRDRFEDLNQSHDRDRGPRRRTGQGNRSGIYFNSVTEERMWVVNRREKRYTRKTLFDVEPTEDQRALEEIQKAAAASGNVGGFKSNGGRDCHHSRGPGGGHPNSYSITKASLDDGDSTHHSGTQKNLSAARALAASAPQQTRHARRLYIGHLPIELEEDEVHLFFRNSIHYALNKEDPTEKDDPILNVYINKERRFAFIEFKTVEVCTACLLLDGIDVCEKGKVKVKRPNDYNPALAPPALGVEALLKRFDVSKLGIVSSTVPDGPNKIFIGGLPYHLAESQVMELLQAFGSVKAFHLVKADATAVTSKGYGFVEYSDQEVTQVAVIGLNGMDMGGGKILSARIAAQRGEEGFEGKDGAGGPLAVPGVGNIAPIVPSSIMGAITTSVPPNMRHVDGVDVEGLIDAAMGLAPMPVIDLMATNHGLVPNNVVGVVLPHLGEATNDNRIMNSPILPTLNVAVPVTVANPVQDATTSVTDTGVLDIANAALKAAFGSSDITVTSPSYITNTNGSDEAPAPVILKSRIIVLLNLVTDKDLATNEEYEILMDEVKDECEKFGTLISMKIPRSMDRYVETAVKKIFLKYATMNDAINAERELTGRQFGNSIIQVTYFNEDDYASENLL